MKRRSFMQMLAALGLAPVLPKVAAQPGPMFKGVTVAEGTAELEGVTGNVGPSCPVGLQGPAGATAGPTGWTSCAPYNPGDLVQTPAGTLCAFYGSEAPKGWRWYDDLDHFIIKEE